MTRLYSIEIKWSKGDPWAYLSAHQKLTDARSVADALTGAGTAWGSRVTRWVSAGSRARKAVRP